jgi:hypothetical protein
MYGKQSSTAKNEYFSRGADASTRTYSDTRQNFVAINAEVWKVRLEGPKSISK